MKITINSKLKIVLIVEYNADNGYDDLQGSSLTVVNRPK